MTTSGETVRTEPNAKRVRTYLGGQLVADTTNPLLVWEVPYYPTYYIPMADVQPDVLVPEKSGRHSKRLGEGQTYTVRAGGREAAGAAVRYESSPVEGIRDRVRFDWAAMDGWFEEDQEVFTHARDPHTRIDALPSSRHVRVLVDGVTLADTVRPTLLFESGLPVRFYLPKPDVRMDLLAHTDTVTHCPYKGQAEYWSVHAGDTVRADLAWSYPTPLPESRGIAGLIAFPQDKVELYVDEVRV